eukprot:TRINITY_DN12390_c0_g1_i1.p2 TRINITY_DN12390_c0_g1~~TRINITY_DN12390_c0_g1_i1.p2  ORF type:complete len:191 (+),score=57.04 TRINITY_DN12390_c0_g1_i1:112-684(+)
MDSAVLRLRVESKEKYILLITKKWMELKDKLINGTYEECEQIYQEIQKNLIMCDSTLTKSGYYESVNKLENDNFQKSINEKEIEIEQLGKEIISLKKEYKQMNIDKKNREQYENMVKLINEYPSKEKTEKEIQVIENEIKQLEDDNEKLNQKFLNHSKQFQLLFFSLQQLDQEIQEDTNKKSNDMDTTSN